MKGAKDILRQKYVLLWVWLSEFVSGFLCHICETVTFLKWTYLTVKPGIVKQPLLFMNRVASWTMQRFSWLCGIFTLSKNELIATPSCAVID